MFACMHLHLSVHVCLLGNLVESWLAHSVAVEHARKFAKPSLLRPESDVWKVPVELLEGNFASSSDLGDAPGPRFADSEGPLRAYNVGMGQN